MGLLSLFLHDSQTDGRPSQTFMDNAQSNEQSSDPKDRWNFYRVYTLFNSVFDATQGDAKSRWDTVRANMAAIAGLGSSQPDIYVLCDDANIWTVTPSNGNPTAWKAPGTFSSPGVWEPFEDTPADQSGDQMEGVQFEQKRVHEYSSAVTCQDGVNNRFQMAYQIKVADVDYIVLCTGNENHKVSLSEISYAEGTDIMDTQTWSTTFFHEIMHQLPLNQRGDNSGGAAAGGERYGWEGVREVRSTYSPLNPDSNKFFAMALSMEEWLWHTGVAVSFNAEYTRLAQMKLEAQQQAQNNQNPDQTQITNTPIDTYKLPSPAPGPWQEG